jgi:imidazoleglycerol phosphate synthase cyclase subunit
MSNSLNSEPKINSEAQLPVRLIPCLYLKNGLIVRSRNFETHQIIGSPISTIQRYSQWNVDELFLIDISAEDHHDLRRDDLAMSNDAGTALGVLKSIAQETFMPLGFGGGVRTIDEIRQRLNAGADKCIINTIAIENNEFITQAAEEFGSQCIVVSVDAKRQPDGSHLVYSHSGSQQTNWRADAWAKEVERLGAGEIFLNSIDEDGAGRGYDCDLIRLVADAVTIPVIACGGVGNYDHFAAGVLQGGASAIAAGNIFHFFEMSYSFAKGACQEAGIEMREGELGNRWISREPVYELEASMDRINLRLAEVHNGVNADRYLIKSHDFNIRWCTRCVYPSISAAPLEFNSEGVCTGCQMADIKKQIPKSEWTRRESLLKEMLGRYKSKDGDNYDCIIPVSGGKDSYFQTHVIKNVLGMNPLLVTYNGNNYTDAGWRNLHRMKDAFGVDHIILAPGVNTLQKLNRLGFIVMGDMNWHAHVGITSAPINIAAKLRVPLIIWGEHGYMDLAGQFSFDDFPEMSYRDRLEHFARGYEWNYFVGLEELSKPDMMMWKYPSDQTLFDLDVRGIYLGNYVFWEANEHVDLVVEKYGFESADEPFQRTYRNTSNLDDMHENGVHDYMKFIKFGYGRCTDHVCKDIRAGIMSRDEGIELIKKYDHVKPTKDLYRWLDYAGMSEQTFDGIADTFRDSRVWRIKNGMWEKDQISGGTASFGTVAKPTSNQPL